MNDIISNSKLKNGFGTTVMAATSPTKRPLSPDHPNPALPITEVSEISFDVRLLCYTAANAAGISACAILRRV